MTNSGVDPFFEDLKRGLALQKAGQRREARSVYSSILQKQPLHAMALHLAGTVAGQLGYPYEAVQLLRKSLAVNPADPMAWNNLANALQDIDATEAAIAACDEAIAKAPGYSAAWATRATALLAVSRHMEAVEAFERAVHLAPHLASAWAGLWRARAESCRWQGIGVVREKVDADLAEAQSPALLPFESLSFTEDPEIHFRCAKAFGDAIVEREAISPHRTFVRRTGRDRIKLAYLSADFHEHATAHLTAEIFERHDRARFEVIAFSFGPDDQSSMRKRLRSAFDQFIDVRALDNETIAERLLQSEVDIAVDLKGYTRGGRTAVFLRKPAPIVVNYLGYPGTMGHSAYDYIIGDPIVTPFADAASYAEKIVQMPHSYQANDTRRAISELVPSRLEEGLPPAGFVFAAFNNCYKITPEFFAVWMRLLKRVAGSVLWLICEQPGIRENLRREASSLGVAPERLIFARRRPLAQHLARHAHADVLLDTLPYNAHTTASDALWAGVPVLTCEGRSFAGRVAASLLAATGLPELVTQTLADYEAMAFKLAAEPQFLEGFRRRIAHDRVHLPLFNSAKFVGDLETAYAHMFGQWTQGLPPAAFAVQGLNKESVFSANLGRNTPSEL